VSYQSPDQCSIMPTVKACAQAAELQHDLRRQTVCLVQTRSPPVGVQRCGCNHVECRKNFTAFVENASKHLLYLVSLVLFAAEVHLRSLVHNVCDNLGAGARPRRSLSFIAPLVPASAAAALVTATVLAAAALVIATVLEAAALTAPSESK
jgi:hypothetical protein